MFKIESLVNTVIKAGKRVQVTTFIVVDQAGEFVSGTKEVASEAEAQAQIDGLGNYAEGLAFAKACFPDQADKAHIGKANIISEYLTWIAEGKPVKEAKPVEAQPEAAAAAEPEAPVSEVEEF